VTAAYEVTEPTVDSQVVNLKSSGAEAFFIAGNAENSSLRPIRKASEIGWKPNRDHRFSVKFDCGYAEARRSRQGRGA